MKTLALAGLVLTLVACVDSVSQLVDRLGTLSR
jgi:hypothetical protein